MWGTDWTRAIKFVSYRESVDCFLDSAPLSLSEKAQLMGKTLDNIYGWSAQPFPALKFGRYEAIY